MDLETRFKNIVLVIQGSTEELSSAEIAKRYLTNPTTSDALTTGTILNTMVLLGYVNKKVYFKGKSRRNKYQSTQKLNYVEV